MIRVVHSGKTQALVHNHPAFVGGVFVWGLGCCSCRVRVCVCVCVCVYVCRGCCSLSVFVTCDTTHEHART